MTITGPGRTLYVSDLDDTLLGADGTLSASARSTLTSVLADGTAFTVATARSPLTALRALEGVPLSLPVVTYGGAVTLSGKLAGSKVSGVRVRLQTTAFPFDAPFADTGNALKSSSSGAYSVVLPAVTRTTRALVVVDGLPPLVSKTVVIRSAVRAGITSTVRRADGRVTVAGRVIPATSAGIAALQRQSAAGKWLPLKRAHVGSDGRYSMTLRARKRAMVVRTVGLPHDGGAHVQGASRSVKIGARRR